VKASDIEGKHHPNADWKDNGLASSLRLLVFSAISGDLFAPLIRGAVMSIVEANKSFEDWIATWMSRTSNTNTS